MESLDALRFPAAILAVIGICVAIYKIIRIWLRQGDAVEEHTKMLKECAEKGIVSKSDCISAQETCQDRQEVSNKAIMKAIEGLQRISQDRDAERHKEMMKMAQSLGRIEGAIGRYHENLDR